MKRKICGSPNIALLNVANAVVNEVANEDANKEAYAILMAQQHKPEPVHREQAAAQ
jgi:hypothetical protein